MQKYHGLSKTPGFAKGKAWAVYGNMDYHVPRYAIFSSDHEVERTRLPDAVKHACQQLEELKENLRSPHADVHLQV